MAPTWGVCGILALHTFEAFSFWTGPASLLASLISLSEGQETRHDGHLAPSAARI